jgi:hypothetical protein
LQAAQIIIWDGEITSGQIPKHVSWVGGELANPDIPSRGKNKLKLCPLSIAGVALAGGWNVGVITPTYGLATRNKADKIIIQPNED